MKKISIMLVALAAILAAGIAQAEDPKYYEPQNPTYREPGEGFREKPLEDYSSRFPLVCIHGYKFYRAYSGSFPTPFPSSEKQEKCGGVSG